MAKELVGRIGAEGVIRRGNFHNCSKVKCAIPSLMPNYRRALVPGGCFFFTVNLLERRQTLLVDQIAGLREAVATTRQDLHHRRICGLARSSACGLDAAPRRPRLLDPLAADQEPLCESVAETGTAQRGSQGARRTRHLAAAVLEHLIRDEADYARHVEYCYINPVKHRWVTRVRDWPYWSFHRDVRAGLFPIDWGGDAETIGEFGER
jgi:putative transposase